MSEKRKSIPKSVRFEVFKRDSFTCQYCGGKAPDVVLHVDHINPVAGGGDNAIVNLITSCEPCNLGKGAKELDDHSALAKQRAQLDDLNERREQLEMMVEWRQALIDIDGEAVDKFEAIFVERTGCGFSDHGKNEARKWLKKYPFDELLAAVDASLDSYFKADDEDTWGQAFAMVPRIVHRKREDADKPWMKDLFYIRGIARNRCGARFKDHEAIDLLKRCYLAGYPIETLREVAFAHTRWTYFRDELEAMLTEPGE